MSLSKEELLRPRFEVIAAYPDSRFKVGEILKKCVIDDEDGDTEYLNEDMSAGLFDNQCEDYPVIFRPMPWYEERKPEEMPEYVRFTKRADNLVDKVVEWKDLNGMPYCNTESFTRDRIYANIASIEPATKEEYISFKNNE